MDMPSRRPMSKEKGHAGEFVSVGASVPRDLAEIFQTVAQAEGKSVSAALRCAMVEYVRAAAQSQKRDDCWRPFGVVSFGHKSDLGVEVCLGPVFAFHGCPAWLSRRRDASSSGPTSR